MNARQLEDNSNINSLVDNMNAGKFQIA